MAFVNYAITFSFLKLKFFVEGCIAMKGLVNFMQNVGDFLDKIASSIAAAAFLIMSVLVIMQVISRCFFSYSFQWAEEMARYLFIWSTMLASACAIRVHIHIGVDVLVNYVRGSLQFAMKLAAQFFIIAAVCILIVYGGQQALEALHSGQTATSFPVSAGVLYMSIPVSGVLMLWYSVTQVFELLCYGEYRKTELQFFGQRC